MTGTVCDCSAEVSSSICAGRCKISCKLSDNAYVRMYVRMYFTICRVYFTPVLCIRPLINQKYEEKTCGEGPNLAVMLDDDHWLTSLGRESLVCMYVSACVYVRTYVHT